MDFEYEIVDTPVTIQKIVNAIEQAISFPHMKSPASSKPHPPHRRKKGERRMVKGRSEGMSCFQRKSFPTKRLKSNGELDPAVLKALTQPHNPLRATLNPWRFL